MVNWYKNGQDEGTFSVKIYKRQKILVKQNLIDIVIYK